MGTLCSVKPARVGVIATVVLLTCASAANSEVGPEGRSVIGPALDPVRTPATPCHGHADADFNGDGASDLAVGAPYATVAGRRRAGAVAVGLGGHVTWLAMRYAERNAGFGATLGTGDFNGDHCADLAVGVPDQGSPRPGADGTGAVYVYLGSRGGLRPGPVLSMRTLGRTRGTDRFGAALAVGDLDRDGRDDLVAGVPGLAGGGGVGVFTRGLRGARLVTQHTAWVGQKASQTDGFGTSLAIGAFDGGRRKKIAVGAPGDGDESSGAVTVIDPTAHASRRITQDSKGVRGVPEPYDRFGAALAAADLDHDGIVDLAVGVPGEDQTTTADYVATGAVHVLYGTGRDDVWALRRAGHQDRFGSALAASDLDGNGTPDLAAGAPGRGVVQIFDGHRGHGMSRGPLIGSPAGGTAQFGWTLTARGRDLYVGAPGARGFGGTVLRVRRTGRVTVQNGSAGELLGYAIA
jgi:hypothetical protein